MLAISRETLLVGALTQILDILITGQRDRAHGLATSSASTSSLVYDDTIGSSRSEERRTIGDTCPARVVVERDVGEAVTDGSEEQGQVTDEPAEPEAIRHFCGAVETN